MEGGVFIGNPLLQRHGGGEGFENRARLIIVGHRLIFPLLPLGRLESLGLFIPRQHGDLGRHVGIGDHLILVGVVIPLGGHGQNRAGIHLHHDADTPVFGPGLLDRHLQIFFREILHRLIDGQHQGMALLRIDGAFVFQGGGHLLAPAVLGGDDPPRLARQHIVVIGFQPLAALVFRVDKAQHAGQQRTAGIIAFIIRDNPENTGAGKTVVLHPLDEGFHQILFNLFLDDFILGVDLQRLLIQPLPVHLQQHGQLIGDLGAHRLVIRDVVGRHDDSPHLGGTRQQLHVGVVD